MTKRSTFLIVLGIVFLLTNGCGGGGGGGGRFTLPGEIPSGGTGTGGTGTGGTGGGTSGQTDPTALTNSAWDDFKLGAYSSSISKINEVLAQGNLTDAQKIEAYNALGWAQAKSSGVESGFNSFSQAATSNNESRIGLASVYMQRGQKSSMSQAVSLLETVGLGDTSFKFTSTHPIGVSNAEAHAMLAFCYFWRAESGDDTKARAQIAAARAEDPAADSSVGQIYATLQAMGLN